MILSTRLMLHQLQDYSTNSVPLVSITISSSGLLITISLFCLKLLLEMRSRGVTEYRPFQTFSTIGSVGALILSILSIFFLLEIEDYFVKIMLLTVSVMMIIPPISILYVLIKTCGE